MLAQVTSEVQQKTVLKRHWTTFCKLFVNRPELQAPAANAREAIADAQVNGASALHLQYDIHDGYDKYDNYDNQTQYIQTTIYICELDLYFEHDLYDLHDLHFEHDLYTMQHYKF